MEKSILTYLGIAFKKITGVNDISLLRKNIKKNIGKIFFHKKYDAAQLVQVMVDMGMKPGSVVCIHSSMKEFYNYKGSANDLIDAILQVLTPEGTLVMPAYPNQNCRNDKNYVFDPLNSPTTAGYLPEQFRKYPGVKRSVNLQHSVCAIGKYADYLINQHHLCNNCWDELSPYYKMTQLGALVFNLGLPKDFMGTFTHCVEGVLYKKYPYWALFFTEHKEYKYYDEKRNIKTYKCIEGALYRMMKKSNVKRYFDKSWSKVTHISNLEIKMFYSRPCFDKMIELGERGISMYSHPSVKGYEFSK